MKIFFFLVLCPLLSYSQFDTTFEYNKSAVENFKKFIMINENVDTVSFMLIEGLTNNFSYPFSSKKIEIKNGIYSLRSGTSHRPTYIFIKKNKKIIFIDNYSLKSLMEEYKNFIKSETLDCILKSKCLEKMIYIYIERESALVERKTDMPTLGAGVQDKKKKLPFMYEAQYSTSRLQLAQEWKIPEQAQDSVLCRPCY